MPQSDLTMLTFAPATVSTVKSPCGRLYFKGYSKNLETKIFTQCKLLNLICHQFYSVCTYCVFIYILIYSIDKMSIFGIGIKMKPH